MQKLHLVGFTTDHEGLILSARRGTRSGGYTLTVDAALADAVEAVLAHQDEEVETADEPVRTPRVESNLPVREIQARLRQGRSIAEVAKAAGVDVTWVDRFAPPVLAERAQVIQRVHRAVLRRQRLGPSSHPIGEAVRHNLADRGVLLSPDEFGASWSAKQIGDDRWAVRCAFQHRGKKKVLRYDLDEGSGIVSAADTASKDFGYVTPPATSTRRAQGSSTQRNTSARPTAKRATSSSGYRPETSGTAATSRSAKERQKAAVAMRQAAAKRAAEAERAAARRLKERAAATARAQREAKATAERAAREERQRQRAAQSTTKAKAAAAKKKSAARAAATRAAAKKVATKQRASARKVATKQRASARKVATKQKASARKVATKQKASARKVATKQEAPVRKAPAVAPRASASATAPVARSTAPRPAVAARPSPVRTAPATVAAPRPVPIPIPVQAPVERRPERPRPLPPAGAQPLFRQGLAQPAAREGGATGPSAPPNGAEGSAPLRRPDRPRRTQPLRAT